jgi:hypothetical protein
MQEGNGFMKQVSTTIACIKLLVIISITALIISITASANCDDPWCNDILPTYGPITVLPGESITLIAPGPWSGFSYSWANYLSGTPRQQTDGGTQQTNTITIPITATTGEDFGVVLTLTQSHSNGVSCISWSCIWLKAEIIAPPSLDNFCYGEATTHEADKFVMAVPTGITYKWFIDGTEQTVTKSYLNGLNPGSHQAVLTLYRGTKLAKILDSITFDVYAKPPSSIVYQ